MRIRTGAMTVLALALALSACGGTQKIGDEEAIGKIGYGPQGELGRFATEKPKTKATGKAAIGKPSERPRTQKKEDDSARRKAEEAVSVKSSITSSGFDPYYLRVRVGGIVLFTNKDSVSRRVTANNGEFDSGDLKPGESFRYKATSPGKIEFVDAARPFVVGTLEVLP